VLIKDFMQLETREIYTERMHADGGPNYNEQLTEKSFWFNVEFFVAFGSALVLLYLQISVMGLNLLWSLFVVYGTMLAVRSLWRQYFVGSRLLEASLDARPQVDFVRYSRMFFSFFLVVMAYYSDPYNSSLVVWAMLLAILWVRELVVSAAHKVYGQNLLFCLYGFFFAVYLISSKILELVGVPYFYLAFAAAICVTLICEYIFELVTVYKVELTAKRGWLLTLLSLFFSVLCLGLVFLLVNVCEVPVLTAGIVNVIVIKLLQPRTLRLLFR